MKDWTGGRASVFKTNGANGSEEREENDFYATDPSCAWFVFRKGLNADPIIRWI